jgi:hypothetical protein
MKEIGPIRERAIFLKTKLITALFTAKNKPLTRILIWGVLLMGFVDLFCFSIRDKIKKGFKALFRLRK